MVRTDLEGLPVYELPKGFRIRWHGPGDEHTWAVLQAPFYDPGAITPDTFYKWFRTDEDEHARRVAYLLDPAGQPVGTAAAWSYDGFHGPEWGRVHWVAVARATRGRDSASRC